MLLELVGVVLGSGQSKTWSNDTLDSGQQLIKQGRQAKQAQANVRRIVGQIEEESDTFHTAVLLEIPGEETGRFHIHTHSRENDREILLMPIMDVLVGFLTRPACRQI